VVKRVSIAFMLAIAVVGALYSQSAPAVEGVALVSLHELEWRLLERVNAVRIRRGLKPLRLSSELASAARAHSNDMARSGFCGHDSATGALFLDRVSRFYRRGAGWGRWAAAENVLCHPRRLTAAAALARWLASPGHRANVLAPAWRDVGLAAVWARRSSGEAPRHDAFFVTADFGARG
jgi:uncharacterized protein YkwD